jgi:hypothetical protein
MAKTPPTPAKGGSKAAAAPAPKKQRFNTLRQMGEVLSLTREQDPSIVWRMIGYAVLAIAIWLGVAYVLLHKSIIGFIIFGLVGAIMIGAAAAMWVLGRGAQKVQFEMLDGQPGAASAVLGQIKRGWYTTPAVAVNRNQEVVTRTVGRAGVVLILEGASPAGMQLLSTEHKRTQRIVGEVPIHDLVIGEGKDNVTLKKLNRTVTKLPKVISQSEARGINQRLQAIQQAPIGIPKGPLPKGAKIPKMPKN